MSKVLCRLSPSHPHLLDSVVIVLQKVMESCPEQVWILLKVEPTELLMGGQRQRMWLQGLWLERGRGGVTVSEMGEGL